MVSFFFLHFCSRALRVSSFNHQTLREVQCFCQHPGAPMPLEKKWIIKNTPTRNGKIENPKTTTKNRELHQVDYIFEVWGI